MCAQRKAPAMDLSFHNPLKREKCNACGASYDAALPSCPKCGAKSEDPVYFRPLQAMSPMGFWKEIILFAAGFGGFQLLGLLVELAVLSIANEALIMGGLTDASLKAGLSAYADSLQFQAIVNYGAYLILFALLLAILASQSGRLFRKIGSQNALIGIPIGIGLLLATAFLNYLIMKYAGATTNENEGVIDSLASGTPWLALLIFGIIGPFCEEVTYRVGLFGSMRRINVILAYFIASIVFGLIHLHDFTSVNEWLSYPTYVLAGLVLALTYEKFGFGASFAAHAANNLISIALDILLMRMAA
jgi:membrane protease YdiL (CAAX protease family)